ncbi:hypothetical protein Q8A67_014664 [Cirrhinus molitorella]|uniref:Uncharacterized protein n=1 Tax=Cirrhinus molitorella TaxID=172907 RepID=A0AA88PH08_9TELE|nr:hypothetical protein Q8A67_014664 [Cirrhinus molitorella]
MATGVVYHQCLWPLILRQEPHRELRTPVPKLSLRLLPAIIMDNDEDDDGNFTKWMSSYWGHGSGEEHAKDRKRSFRRPSRNKADRRASLPCMSQLEAMRVNHLHANTMAPVPVHLKSREEKEVHAHPRARRVSSDENSRTKVGGPECHISTIPELTECLEKRLRFNNQKVISVVVGTSYRQWVLVDNKSSDVIVGNLWNSSNRAVKQVMQIAYVLFAMKNYGMEEVAFKNFTVAIIFIKSYDTETPVSDYGLRRQNGRSTAHVHVVGVLHLLVTEERRYRSALNRRNIAYPVANSLYVDNNIPILLSIYKDI